MFQQLDTIIRVEYFTFHDITGRKVYHTTQLFEESFPSFQWGEGALRGQTLHYADTPTEVAKPKQLQILSKEPPVGTVRVNTSKLQHHEDSGTISLVVGSV